MNANFKGVSVVLSDKAAGDIWDKIGEIDEKDAEQDAKDVEQDEAIAGKLDKDDGMGLVDEKLGGIDREIEELEEDIGEINDDINGINGRADGMEQDIASNLTAIGNLQTALTNLTTKVNSIVNNAYSYREVALHRGMFPLSASSALTETLTLSEPITNFDYIDVYTSPTIGEYTSMRTFRVSDVVDRGMTIYHATTADGGQNAEIVMTTFNMVLVGDSTTQMKINYYSSMYWEGGNENNAEVMTVFYTYIGRIVGRKLTPLSQIIS